MKPKPDIAPLDIAQADDGTWLITAHAAQDGGGRPKGRPRTYALTTDDLIRLWLAVARQLLTYAPKAFAKLFASLAMMKAGE